MISKSRYPVCLDKSSTYSENSCIIYWTPLIHFGYTIIMKDRNIRADMAAAEDRALNLSFRISCGVSTKPDSSEDLI